MDKISAALITGIIVLMITCGFIIYDTWVKEDITYEIMVIHEDTSDEPLMEDQRATEPLYL